MFNVQEILPFVGYGLIGIFILIGAFIIIAIVRDKKKNATPTPESVHMEDNQKEDTPKLNLKGLNRKQKNQLKKEESNGLFTSSKKHGKQEEPVGFAISRGSSDASKIAEELAETRGARSLTPRNRTSSPDDLLVSSHPDEKHGVEDEPKTPFRAFATRKNVPVEEVSYEEPAVVAPVEPVAPKATPTFSTAPAPLPQFTPPQQKLPTNRPTSAPVAPVAGMLPPPPVIKQAPTDPARRILVNKPENLKNPPSLNN